MKICRSWLREWVDAEIDSAQLAEQLTMLGLEVESVTVVGERSDALVAARVIETRRHPNADRLTVCDVDIGRGQPIGIVCGARNVRQGGVYVAALPGARLANGRLIEASTIRGQASGGMLCSATELGLGDLHEGLLELDRDTSPGTDARALLELGDFVLDLNITPNRADCFSVIGIAREVSAASGASFLSRTDYRAAVAIDDQVAVTVSSPVDCPRFSGRVIRGLSRDARTPVWMSERLRRCGIRPIHPVVDVGNYVMLELGQPMHVYDLDRLPPSGIQVRRSGKAEKIVLLDGRVVDADSDMLVIADASGPIALAGIMGGQSTAVTATTSNVFLESAFFAPAAIAGRARRAGLHTDASQRFERGVDPSGQARAIERATELILAVAGGRAGPLTDIIHSEHVPSRTPVRLRRSRLTRVLGTEAPVADVTGILRRLDMRVDEQGTDWLISAPAARFDLECEEDFIEEVARMFGYERIPETAGRHEVHLASTREDPDGLATLRATLVARGFQEVVTYSFIAPAIARLFGAAESEQLVLSNPISADMAVMRQSLWPGLVTVARENLNRQQSRLRLFEIGPRFSAAGSARTEELAIAGVIIGQRLPEQWGTPPLALDVFDLKAEVEALLGLSGELSRVRFDTAVHPALHPGRSASIRCGDRMVGWLGEIHPSLAAELGIPNAVLFEFVVDRHAHKPRPRYDAISRFPAVRRDIAVVVPREVQTARLMEVLLTAAPAVVREATVFDIYTGPQVGETEKSVAIGLILQDTSRTLTDQDAESTMQQLRLALTQELRARFRE